MKSLTQHSGKAVSLICASSSAKKCVGLLSTLFASLIFMQTGFAQTSSTSETAAGPQSENWIKANSAVGKFLRGHVDILRAEAAGKRGQPVDQPQQGSLPGGELLSLQKAKALFLQARPSLFATGGESPAERNRQAAAVIEGLSQIERAWIQATGSQLILKHQQDVTQAAEIAEELARRMGKLGNWGASRVISAELLASDQRLKLLQARQRALEARYALANLIQTRAFSLPDRLPSITGIGARNDLAATPESLALDRLQRAPEYSSRVRELQRLESSVGTLALEQWQTFALGATARALEAQGPSALTVDRSAILWNHDIQKVLSERESLASLRVQTETTIAMAQAQVRSRHAQAMLLTSEILPLAIQAEEEAIYQYNGMFISTWDLLDQYRARVDVQIAQIEAQMQYWDAHHAYQAYLAGAPYIAPSQGGAGPTAGSGAKGAGH